VAFIYSLRWQWHMVTRYVRLPGYASAKYMRMDERKDRLSDFILGGSGCAVGCSCWMWPWNRSRSTKSHVWD